MTTVADLGFLLYDDAPLTIVSNPTWTVECKTDLSDGQHDATYYFGSNEVNKKLITAVNPGVDNITLTPTYILSAWEASTAYSLGDSIIPTTPNGYRYECTVAGTSGGSEPTWGVILNGTTASGTATFTLVAEDSPTTEIILALSEADLNTNTPGAALSLGNEILSGVSNAIEIWVRLTNTITVVSDSIGTPELGVNINAVEQSSV